MAAVIEKLTAHYRLAGRSDRRAHLARRMERVTSDLLLGALEEVSGQDETGSDGPVICIRKLRLSLWLDTAKLDDGATARCWAQAIMKAIYRQQAEGGPADVMRFPSEQARLASWVADLLDGRASIRWYWHDFRIENDMPAGTAIATVLSRNSRHIGEVFTLLAASGHAERTIGRLGEQDVLSLWHAWTGGAPAAAKLIPPALIEKMRNLSPPPLDAITRAGRARTAFAWLVELVTGPPRMKVEVAGGAALQLAHISALATASPLLRRALAQPVMDRTAVLALLNDLPGELASATDWFRQVTVESDGLQNVAMLCNLALAAGKPEKAQPAAVGYTRMRSSHAGAALLLPSLNRLGLADRLGPLGRQKMLAASVGKVPALLARMDPVLRLLTGVPENALPDLLPEPDWPDAADLGVALAAQDKEWASHMDGAELAALRACADDFATGMRGMSGSSLQYLARQFFNQSGTLTVERDLLTIRLDGMPLSILLRRAGRLGEQGALAWLGGRQLVLELANG